MNRLPLCFAVLAALASTTAAATQLNYHGDLMDGDRPASGRYDLRLRTFADGSGKAVLGGFVELPNVAVIDGGFAVELDLKESPLGDTFVEIAVRKADSGEAFEVLGAAQKLAKANNGCWALDGNTGLAAGSFLGNADPASTAPLVLRARNSAVATLTPRGSPGAFGDAPSVVLGSAVNVANQPGAIVSGGGATLDGIGSPCASCKNQATASFATVGGGIANRASGGSSTIAGGSGNTATDGDGAIGGGSDNTTSDSWATVAGGSSNAAMEIASTVGGGEDNTAAGLRATVAGGHWNQATNTAATIGGGDNNSATGVESTVAGGSDNDATASSATVGGGFANQAIGPLSTIAGGNGNAVLGSVATVPGGFSNCAGGSYSFAAGSSAKIRPATVPGSGACAGIGAGGAEGDRGTFVWSDSQIGNFVSSGNNQFLVRAGGGVGINASSIENTEEMVIAARANSDADVSVGWNSPSNKYAAITLYDATGDTEIRAQDGHLFLATTGFSKYVHTNDKFGVKRVPVTNDLEVNGSASKSAAGDWLSNSDRRIKRDIALIDDALATIMKLRPVTFRYDEIYRGERPSLEDKPYYNVIAQEFAQVFPDAVKGSGEYLPGRAKSRENEILQVDTYPAQITAIAAIQELAVHDDAQRDEIAALKSENTELHAALAELSARLARIETRQER